MPLTLGTGAQVPTTTRTTATLFCPSSRITPREHVTIEEVFDAYYECRRHKRSKRSAVEYEMNYELNNYRLWQELNSMTYKPSASITFCVTKPKLREIYAANFRDRVVHHLLIGRINSEIEHRLSDSAAACREGKGTLYCARRLKKMMEECKDGWYAKLDISGFFMSIDKAILAELVNDVICSHIKDDLAWWLWLADVIIWHEPEKNCEYRGNRKLREMLPENKKMGKRGKGMAIGNLPSQVFANLYLAAFDWAMIKFLGSELRHIRYADDFKNIHPDKKVLLKSIDYARRWLKEKRGLELHKNKVIIQKVSRGVRFAGYFIKGGVIHAGQRARGNAINLCREWNLKENHTEAQRVKLMARYNSYSGLLKHCASYKIRRKMWRMLGDYENITNINMNKIKITKQ